MNRPLPMRFVGLAAAMLALFGALAAHLAIGVSLIPLPDIAAALFRFDPDSYDHTVLRLQRLPRALIAAYAGAAMAVAGVVLQGLTRNPLAAPATLGINAGAALAVVLGSQLFGLGLWAQGLAAFAGGAAGFWLSFGVARLTGLSRDPRGLALILSGALVSMLLVGVTNAVLLADPQRRSDLLGWIAGNINHVYADRLYAFWWAGAFAFLLLMVLARPLTLIQLGHDKAASAGVRVALVTRAALGAVALAAASAVAICGPVGFVGLVVPHIARPLVGASMRMLLPVCALMGATLCLLADLGARTLFLPYILHTGIVLDLLGGVVFAVIVKRVYLRPGAERPV
ncbi:FecCD family ABC transporter permease [Actibacterium lipolyticum]|uniref:Putative siderophore transport system permease protein YfiZ n=1 Tax=Actibacterium lipolyticum TaxID=1524263 RepID=A0A238L9S5_9RHOB|nr:iron ABC transporter permease [Actibacterium lipolyticum]SMX51066.1 putative siderophore transport system permease protein YfiZ precursor [Actibacterium lipolyticum]